MDQKLLNKANHVLGKKSPKIKKSRSRSKIRNKLNRKHLNRPTYGLDNSLMYKKLTPIALHHPEPKKLENRQNSPEPAQTPPKQIKAKQRGVGGRFHGEMHQSMPEILNASDTSIFVKDSNLGQKMGFRGSRSLFPGPLLPPKSFKMPKSRKTLKPNSLKKYKVNRPKNPFLSRSGVIADPIEGKNLLNYRFRCKKVSSLLPAKNSKTEQTIENPLPRQPSQPQNGHKSSLNLADDPKNGETVVKYNLLTLKNTKEFLNFLAKNHLGSSLLNAKKRGYKISRTSGGGLAERRGLDRSRGILKKRGGRRALGRSANIESILSYKTSSLVRNRNPLMKLVGRSGRAGKAKTNIFSGK